MEYILIAFTLFVSLNTGCKTTTVRSKPEEIIQIKVVREMKAVLDKNYFAKFYFDYCHPHFQRQIPKDKFIEVMNIPDFRQQITDLLDEIVKAIDTNQGKDILIHQYQEDPQEYEFVLVKVKGDDYGETSKKQWHLELMLDGDKWKMKDTD